MFANFTAIVCFYIVLLYGSITSLLIISILLSKPFLSELMSTIIVTKKVT